MVKILRERTLRRKLGYTLMVVLVAAGLSQIPVIGINSAYLSAFFSRTGITGFMDALSGGSLSRLSAGTFGITSYITASIIIQLLTVAFPSLEKMRKDGEQGRRRFERAEFILSMAVTVLGATALAIGFGKRGLFRGTSPVWPVIAVAEWTAVSFVIVKLALSVEKKGIGNGPTLILGMNILGRIPSQVISYFLLETSRAKPSAYIPRVAGTAAGAFLVVLIATYMQQGVLRVRIRQSRKKSSALSSDGYIPVPAGIASVLPVIYASTLFSMPQIIVSISGRTPKGALKTVIGAMTSTNWYQPKDWTHIAGLAAYILLMIAFGYFSTMLSFSPDEIADTMRKNGDVIPGVNPGEETAAFLDRRRKVMTGLNLAFLILITIVPEAVATATGNGQLSFAGTSLIIVISMLEDEYRRLRAETIHGSRKFDLFPTEVKKKAGKEAHA